MDRDALIRELASHIASIRLPHPTRVAIDGVDGAGKTTLADELAEPLERLGRSVIRGSIDRFHRPRSARYRRGRDSPEGYFLDSFDHETLVRRLLAPLGPGGELRYRTAAFDYRTDTRVDPPAASAEANAVLLFDGVFLHRAELRSHWDTTIFLDVPFEVSVARMAARDGVSPSPAAPENRRYAEGQRLYLASAEPGSRADVMIDHADPAQPILRRAPWQTPPLNGTS